MFLEIYFWFRLRKSFEVMIDSLNFSLFLFLTDKIFILINFFSRLRYMSIHRLSDNKRYLIRENDLKIIDDETIDVDNFDMIVKT